jgi:hypothetical protein
MPFVMYFLYNVAYLFVEIKIETINMARHVQFYCRARDTFLKRSEDWHKTWSFSFRLIIIIIIIQIFFPF